MALRIGLRVVRGPDWSWEEQDGGEGHVGTVVRVEEKEGGKAEEEEEKEEKGAGGAHAMATVQWDSGFRSEYRCGVDGKYDLRVFDSAAAGVVHDSVTCDGCKEDKLPGVRWKCAFCYDYDLCTPCYMADKHDLTHPFRRYGDHYCFIARMPPRNGMVKVEAKGLFPGAEVVRGPDWSWKDQDGGSGQSGKVTGVERWKSNARSSIAVEWNMNHSKNKYRAGYEGKVDLKCVVPGNGGWYYPDHLPVLGAPVTPPSASEFSSGEFVRVELEAEVFESMQAGHGGWSSEMAKLKNKIGSIHSITETGDFKIRYGEEIWTINPSAVIKVEMPEFAPGTTVRIMDDLVEMKKLQQNWGGWNDIMAESLGHLGVVKGMAHFGVVVGVKGYTWVLNPLCLKPADPDEQAKPDKEADVKTGTERDLILRLKMISLVAEDSSEGLLYAAVLGEVTVITEYLKKYPNEVNSKYQGGKSAIHCAALYSQIAALNILLEFGADVNIEDEDGDRPLHYCASKGFDEATKILLDAGADMTLLNNKGVTPVLMAALNSNVNVLKIFTSYSSTALCHQDSEGDTALHRAVHARHSVAVKTLLDAGADPTLVNFHLNTPLHLAAIGGLLTIAEEIATRFPNCLNLLDDEDATPLHLAGFKDHLDLTKFFLQQKDCNREAKTQGGHTPLQAAVIGGHTRIIECFVGYGVDLNAIDDNKETALHLALKPFRDFKFPSDDAPQMKKVLELIKGIGGSDDNPQVIVACFLIQEGARLDIRGQFGLSALDVCSPQVAVIISDFSSKYGGKGTFHGSLGLQRTSVSLQQTTEEDKKEESQLNQNKDKKCDPEEKVSLPTAPACPSPDKKDKGEEVSLEQESIPRSSPTTDSDPAVSSEEHSTDVAVSDVCILCDSPVTVKFRPCGHSVLCELCAVRAKRCPDCKVTVLGIIQQT